MKTKRILASLLSVIMLLGTFGFSAFAEDTDVAVPAITIDGVEYTGEINTLSAAAANAEEVVINSGEYIAESFKPALTYSAEAKLVINGGTFTGWSALSLNNATVEINGGVFKEPDQENINNVFKAIDSRIVINDGDFDYYMLFWTESYDEDIDDSVIINDGVFKLYGEVFFSDTVGEPRVEINGGSFDWPEKDEYGKQCFVTGAALKEGSVIKGGSFSTKNGIEEFVSADLCLKSDTDGFFTITEPTIMVNNKGYASLEDAISAANEMGGEIVVELLDDVVIDERWGYGDSMMFSNGNITLYGNGHSIIYGENYNDSTHLSLGASGNAVLNLGDAANKEKSKLTITKANPDVEQAVLLFAVDGNAEVNMYDGVVITGSNNTSSTFGAAVRVCNGIFNMYGGKINNNKSVNTFGLNYGAGVWVEGTFNMHDGEISGNTAEDAGAAIAVINDAEAYIYGGVIKDNITKNENYMDVELQKDAISGGKFDEDVTEFVKYGYVAYKQNESDPLYEIMTISDAAAAAAAAKGVEVTYEEKAVDVGELPAFIPQPEGDAKVTTEVKIEAEDTSSFILNQVNTIVDEIKSNDATSSNTELDITLEFDVDYVSVMNDMITLDITPMLIATNEKDEVVKEKEINLKDKTVKVKVYVGLEDDTKVAIYHKADDGKTTKVSDEDLTVFGGGYVEFTTSEGFSNYYVKVTGIDTVDPTPAAPVTKDITVKLEKVADKTGAYTLKLVADTDARIYRFDSADLTFKLTPAENEYGDISDIGYTFTAADFIDYDLYSRDMNDKINKVVTDKYRFNVNGAHFTTGSNDNDDRVYELTGVEIPLGTIQFNGFGAFEFSIEEDANTTVNTALQSGAADGSETFSYVTANADGAGKLKFDYEATKAVELAQIKNDLTVVIDFINAIEKKDVDYTGMTVKIEGKQGTENSVQLGSNPSLNGAIESVTFETLEYYIDASGEKVLYRRNGTDVENVTVPTDAKKDINTRYTVVANLPINDEYKITVEGDGYRTATKTYKLLESSNVEVKFWNNVAASGSEKVNFLAGDIVKDNNINIYDLSAVVSYFRANTATEGYNQYDLNRDGNINTIDISNLLKSWNN